MKLIRSAHRRPLAGVAVFLAITVLAAGCSSDAVESTPSTPSESETTATSADTGDTTPAAPATPGTPATPATPAADSIPQPAEAVDTTYLDLYVDQGILYNPFYGDALGGDINYVEPECTKAVTDLASFGTASSDVDAASVLASLTAVGGDVPSNFPGALDAWQTFIADHYDTYNGPFLAIGQGVFDETTLQQALTDADVVSMLDAYTSLELIPPSDYLTFLNSSCTAG